MAEEWEIEVRQVERQIVIQSMATLIRVQADTEEQALALALEEAEDADWDYDDGSGDIEEATVVRGPAVVSVERLGA